MSDIKLFSINGDSVQELEGQSVSVEKSLQKLIEKHLFALLGVRFLESEYITGKTHGGRIDTLGIDENGSPVIIEYKRSLNENVINQGLYYLDWLLDHKAEFTLLVMKHLGPESAEDIDWPSARLLCIAGDFTKFDEHAVKQINRNIELLRYRRYGGQLLILELVNATSGQTEEQETEADKKSKKKGKTFEYMLEKSSDALKDRYETLKAFMLALGDDVQMKTLKNYVAFKRLRNFACIEPHPQADKLVVWVNIGPDTIQLEEGITRDVRNIGHHGTGDLEITITADMDVEKAQQLILKSYELS